MKTQRSYIDHIYFFLFVNDYYCRTMAVGVSRDTAFQEMEIDTAGSWCQKPAISLKKCWEGGELPTVEWLWVSVYSLELGPQLI